MRKRTFRKGAAVVLALMISIDSIAGHGIVPVLTSYADERPALVSASTLNVRSGPGTNHSIVTKLYNGTSVTVINETNGSDGKVWYQIRFSGGAGTETTGYARSDYIRFPATYTTDADFENYLSSQGFPESYKGGLRQLHAMYPNWVFTAQHTNLDWNTVIENEALVGRNLIYNGSISSWKSTADGAYNWETSTWPAFDSGNYVAASDALIRYYMDPRNFLDDMYVFQFLLHSYDASVHTAEGLRSMVKGTFLEGSASVSGDMSASPSGGGTGSANSGGPGVSGSSGASTQAPGYTGSSSTGTQAPSGGSSGASTQAPGYTGSSSAGTQAPSGGSGVSTQAPGYTGGSSAGTQAPSGGSGNGVSTQAPGYTGGSSAGTQAPSGGSGSGVSRQAPGSVASAGGTGMGGRLLGTVRGVFDSSRILRTMTAPGMTSGPTGNTNSAVDYSAGPGALGVSPGGTSSSPGSGSGSAAPQADYVDIIMNAGMQSGVNPYVLASIILQEQGVNGTGRSISGTVSGYAGYYNFFNIDAYQSGGMDAVTRGLWYASQSGSYNRPWNSVDKSIIGGAIHYGTNYVKVGQDTFYLKKFNVQGSNLYKHQYMTNVQAAASEGAKLAEAYGETLKKTALEFKIPVYLNMPSTACARPTVDGSPNNKLSGLAVDGFALTPTFNRDTANYDLIVNSSVAQVTVNASAYSSSASISGTGTVDLQSGINEIVISVKAENGDVRQYVIRVVRQQNGPTHNSALSSGTGSSPSSGSGTGPGGNTGSSGGPGVSSGSGNAGPGAAGSAGGPAVSGAAPGGSSSAGMGPGGSNVTIVQ